MELEDSLKLERYKFVIDRQKYFTELARDAFASYAKLYGAAIAGAVAVISARSRLSLRPDTVVYLVRVIAILVTVLGIVGSTQILFCLARWWGFRSAERKIYAQSPPVHWWWWAFETMYILAILAGIVGAWLGLRALPDLLTGAPAATQ